MSNPIVMPALERTEIHWSNEPNSVGLMITQADSLGNEDGAVWIPEGHVPAFIAAIQKVSTKR